jgi:hypothetical protein
MLQKTPMFLVEQFDGSYIPGVAQALQVANAFVNQWVSDGIIRHYAGKDRNVAELFENGHASNDMLYDRLKMAENLHITIGKNAFPEEPAVVQVSILLLDKNYRELGSYQTHFTAKGEPIGILGRATSTIR